jgi:hypothetical protein
LRSKKLTDLIKEVREKTKENWQILEHEYKILPPLWKFFKKPTVEYFYTLCVEVGGFCPYQIINFYRSETDWSINTETEEELVVAYLYGLLAGIHQQKRLTETSETPATARNEQTLDDPTDYPIHES